jgi:heme oxygenase
MIEIRSFLRDETSELHRELDAIVGVFSNRAEYARFLQGTFRHRAPVEAALLSADAARISSWQPRRLLPELEADLADLGLPLPTAEPFRLSNDMAAFLGAAYVLEGSALGARVLVKGVDALGFGPAHGARYLSAQAGSLESWRALLVALDGLDRPAWEAAAQAARTVFLHAIQAFTSEELSPA